jgi:hypothetical protein
MMKVKSLKKVITLLLLALWPLVVMHCKLETIPGLEFLRCASDTDTSSDCEGDGCQTVESATYKPPDHQNVTPQPVFQVLALSALPEGENRSRDHDLCWFVSSVPPELRKVWQFSFRTALPPRAPSIVS